MTVCGLWVCTVQMYYVLCTMYIHRAVLAFCFSFFTIGGLLSALGFIYWGDKYQTHVAFMSGILFCNCLFVAAQLPADSDRFMHPKQKRDIWSSGPWTAQIIASATWSSFFFHQNLVWGETCIVIFCSNTTCTHQNMYTVFTHNKKVCEFTCRLMFFSYVWVLCSYKWEYTAFLYTAGMFREEGPRWGTKESIWDGRWG